MSRIIVDALQANAPTHSAPMAAIVLVALLVCIGLGKALTRMIGSTVKAITSLVFTTARNAGYLLLVLLGVFGGCAAIVTAMMAMVART